jgi:peptide/nickel transport system permease protein
MRNNFFSSQAWTRLKKNKLAFTGLIIIILSFLIAIFGYFLAPDNSPYADLQTVEIQARQPGYEQLFLKIPDERPESKWYKTLLYGKPPSFRYLPIRGQLMATVLL